MSNLLTSSLPWETLVTSSERLLDCVKRLGFALPITSVFHAKQAFVPVKDFHRDGLLLSGFRLHGDMKGESDKNFAGLKGVTRDLGNFNLAFVCFGLRGISSVIGSSMPFELAAFCRNGVNYLDWKYPELMTQERGSDVNDAVSNRLKNLGIIPGEAQISARRHDPEIHRMNNSDTKASGSVLSGEKLPPWSTCIEAILSADIFTKLQITVALGSGYPIVGGTYPICERMKVADVEREFSDATCFLEQFICTDAFYCLDVCTPAGAWNAHRLEPNQNKSYTICRFTDESCAAECELEILLTRHKPRLQISSQKPMNKEALEAKLGLSLSPK